MLEELIRRLSGHNEPNVILCESTTPVYAEYANMPLAHSLTPTDT